MNIFVDVDGVCANLLPIWIARYNRDYNDNLTVEKIKNWELIKSVKYECGNKIYEYLNDPTLYDEVKPIPYSRFGCQILGKTHRIIFATSSTNGSAGRKLRWLVDHKFLSVNRMKGSVSPDYIEVHDKGLLRGDILLDDGPHNVRAFKGFSILFDQNHNTKFSWDLRAKNWYEVIRIVNMLECARTNNMRFNEA